MGSLAPVLWNDDQEDVTEISFPHDEFTVETIDVSPSLSSDPLPRNVKDPDDNTTTDEEESPTLPKSLSCRLWTSILILSILPAFDAMVDLTLGPYVSEIVLDWGETNPSKIGYYAAVMNGTRYFAMFFSGFYFTWLSSHVGRRPALIVSQISNICICFLLCFSTNVWYFCILRAIGGLTNGMYTLIKAVIGEDKRIPRRWRGFSTTFLPMFFLLFCIVGSAVGGALARVGFPNSMLVGPEVLSRATSGTKFFFQNFGTFFPNLFCFLCSIVGLVLLVVGVFETHPETIRQTGTEAEVELYEEYLTHVNKMDRYDILLELKESRERSQQEEEEGEGEEDQLLHPTGAVVNISLLATMPLKDKCRTFFTSEVFTKQPILCMLMDVLLLAGGFFLQKSLPVFLALKDEFRGLGFDSMSVAAVLIVFAVVAMLVSVLYSIIIDYINPVWILRTITFGMILIVFFPEAYYLKLWVNSTLAWAIVMVLDIWAASCFAVTIMSVFVVENNSVSLGSKEMLNMVVGPFGCLAEGSGPFLGNLLLGVGADVNTFPIDSHLCLIIGALVFVLIGILSWCVDPRLRFPVAEPKHALEDELVAITDGGDRMNDQQRPEKEEDILKLSEDDVEEFLKMVFTKQNFKVVHNKDGIKMEVLNAPGESLITVRATLTVANITARILNDLFNDLAFIHEYDDLCDRWVLLDEFDEHRDVSLYISKKPMKWLPIFPREFLTARYKKQLTENSFLVINRNCTHPDRPETREYVRGHVFYTVFYVEQKTDTPTDCTFIWISKTDLKGSVPKWGANWLTKKKGPVAMRRIREAAPQYVELWHRRHSKEEEEEEGESY